MADKRKIDRKTRLAVRKKDGEIGRKKEREQRDMADKRKIDRKTWQAVRRKDGEIWQTEKREQRGYGRQRKEKDRQIGTAGCQKERRRDLADRNKESREIWQTKER
jgi:hypothetical protein